MRWRKEAWLRDALMTRLLIYGGIGWRGRHLQEGGLI